MQGDHAEVGWAADLHGRARRQHVQARLLPDTGPPVFRYAADELTSAHDGSSTRRKKPIPAVLEVTRHVVLEEGSVRTIERPVVEHLVPTDPLRLRLVASDPDVREALELARFTRAQVAHLRKLAAPTPEWAAAHAAALEAHASAVRDVLTPAILAAEEERRLIVALTPADHAALARAVVRRVDSDRVLAVDNLLRRNPSWKDPALWSATDTVRYLAKAVSSEARIIGRRQKLKEAPLTRGETGPRKPGVRRLRSVRSPAEAPMLRREEAAERRERVRRGLELLRQLYRELPADQRQIVVAMAREKCGPYEAARRLGLARSTAVALRARAERLLAKQRQSVGHPALH